MADPKRIPPAVLGPFPAGPGKWVTYVVPEGWLWLEEGELELGVVRLPGEEETNG